MRLRRLELLRYGHLSDVALEFPDEAALHVVLGPNEAGKSTSLEAIGDALFGIPERSPRGFLHGNQQLRIGFVLAGADGGEARFLRRKGRGATLRDAAEEPVTDAALGRFLAGADRTLFERGFGLDGEGLREGGRDLLRSGGDLGESLLAGMGLRHLRAALDRLDGEAKELHGDGRGRRRLALALEARQQADRDAEAASLRPREWDDAAAEEASLRAAIKAAQARSRDLTAEGSRLERLRRVRPLLARLGALRAEFAGLAQVPRLPSDAEAVLRRAVGERRLAERDIARTAETMRAHVAERSALAEDPAVLALGPAIDALAEQRPVVVQAMADLPEIRAKVAAWRAEVADAARDLGATSEPPEALRDRAPPAGLRSAAQRLIEQRATLVSGLDAGSRALDRARRKRDAAAEALGAAPPPPDPAPLRRAIDAARREGPVERDLAAATAEHARVEAALRTALAALPLWTGDAEALAACPLPLEAEVAVMAGHLEAAGAEVEAATRAQADLRAEIAREEEEVARLAAGETMPTEAVIAAARAAREEAWRRVRQALEGGDAPADPPTSLAEAFEALRDTADRLADRRATEAQRVADYAARMARLDLLRGRADPAAAALEAALAALQAAGSGWRALWSAAGIAAAAPPAMLEWRRAREDVLRFADQEREARSRRDALAARHAAARAALAAACPAAAMAPGLDAALALAEDELAAQQAATAAHGALAEALAAEERRLPDLEEARTTADEALFAFAPRWEEATMALGLSPGASTEALQAALEAWARVATAAAAWRGEDRRVADMEATIAGFGAEVERTLAALPDQPAAETTTIAARQLAERLTRARATRERAARLSEAMAGIRAEAADAARRRDTALAEIATLQAASGAADEAGLDAAVAASLRRDALGGEIRAAERDLAGQGDGLDEATLRAEVAAIDPDAAAARLAAIAAEQAEVAERLSRLGGDLARAEERLEGMRRGRDAAAHAQAAEDALAEAREVAARYARLHLARTLLRAGIERMRREQQNPLLQQAGAHFARLTGGRYRRLLAEEGSNGHATLIALRDEGTECHVDALSEGTRDQLFLALRVAWVEGMAARGAALPFIADDLLVQFDDARAAAAVGLLAELGRSTQVILFTHHDHLAAIAGAQPGVRVQRLPG